MRTVLFIITLLLYIAPLQAVEPRLNGPVYHPDETWLKHAIAAKTLDHIVAQNEIEFTVRMPFSPDYQFGDAANVVKEIYDTFFGVYGADIGMDILSPLFFRSTIDHIVQRFSRYRVHSYVINRLNPDTQDRERFYMLGIQWGMSR